MAQKNKKASPTTFSPSSRLALSASVAAALLSGYGARQAYAGSCAPTGPAGTYTCSGAAGADSMQNLNAGANPLTVTTTSDFGITTAAGNAFTLSTAGLGLTFTDMFSSSITGGTSGILAFNLLSGALSITTTGAVTGTGNYGIYAQNNGTDLTINAASVSGGLNGIIASNLRSGALSITTTGAVTGTSYAGILARNNGTDLTINAASVSGGFDGIVARNFGSGALSITTTGAVTGTSDDGIFAQNNGTGTDLTINAASVSGGYSGIVAFNLGSGALSITTTGAVTGTGYYGILAQNGTGTDLTINAASVSGGTFGIVANNFSSGVTSITVSGAVTGGGRGAGILNESVDASTITLNSGASVSATSGVAILDTGANTTVTMNTGASVTGIIDLGDGADAIVLSGGDFSGVTNFDGGLGANDRLTFSGSNGIFDQALMNNIEAVTINNGSGMGLTFTGDAFNATALTGGALIVQNGGILNATNGFTLTGNLINSTGTISLQNNTIDAAATITGDFTGGGQLLMDINPSNDTADRLNINGSVLAGGTQVTINDIAASNSATGNAITLISVGGTTAAGDFTLANSVVNGAFDYNTLALVGSEWVLQSVAGTGGATGGPAYTPFASSFEALGRSLLTLETLPSLVERNQQRLGGKNNSGANSGDETGVDSLVWLRVAGGYRDIDSHRSTTGANFDTQHWKAQIGVDIPVADTASGRFVTGLNAGYSQADTDVKATAGKSNIDTTGYSLGLTGTWYGLNGVYVDTQLQRSWYETDLSAGGTGAGKVNDVDGDGYSASIEIGKNIALNESLSITPQAQLVYAKVDTDTFTGANAELVKLSKSKSLKARLGADLTKRFTEDGATRGFILANVIHEFEDETQVNVSGAQLANTVDEWSGELGVGMTHAWNRGTTIHELSASVTGSTSLNNFGDSNAAQGKVSYKVNF